MGSIAAGEVGIVLGLEVSRLARDNADWHQLLRIAGITNTLILDETGIYDPNDGNDKLLLGVKGDPERVRAFRGSGRGLVGGQRSAAARGALKMRLAVGLAYNDKDEVVFDPDRSVFDAIRLVFDRFRRMGSAMAVVKWMHRENIELPARPRSGPANGELRWALPRVPQVTRIVRNPRYAGAYVYGQTHVERRADGTGRLRVVPMEDWHVCIPDAHVGFIDWDEYLRNRATLRGNAAAFLGIGLAHRGAPRGGGAVAVAGDLRPLRPAHGHAIQPRSPASQPAGARHLRLQRRAGPLRTEDLPEHARRSRRRRDIALRDRRVER